MLKTLIRYLFLFLPFVLQAQQYNFQYYSVAEGLAQSQVYALIEDQDGYLWMSTHGEGLNRFDGRDFENFTLKDGLINNNVDVIYEVNDQLYIGARNGMSVFDGRDFQNYFISKTSMIGVTAFQWYEGQLLVGTTDGVYEFKNGDFSFSKKYNNNRKLPTTCFFQDSKNRLWIGTENGVFLHDQSEVRHFTAKDNFTNGAVTSIDEAKDGRLWLSTFTGAYSFVEMTFTSLNNNMGIASNYLNDVTCDNQGLIWLGSQDKGITIWNPVDSSVTQLDAETGLCNNNVTVIQQDSWGGIWIATSGGGVCKYTGQQFMHLNISNQVANNLVYSICQDTTGTMWFAAADDGIVRKDSVGFTRFGAKEGFVNSKCKAMLRDRKGRLWFGSNGSGVAYYNGKNFEFLKYKNRPLGNYTKDILEDEAGDIWVAGNTGVYKIQPGDSTIQLQDLVVDTFLLNDSLMIRTDTMLRDTSVFVYSAIKINVLNFRVNALHFDQLGRLWFASASKGVGYYSANGVVTFDRASGLPANEIRSLIEDEKGHLWLGTAGYGIVRLSIYQDSLNIQTFNENDGLSSGNVYLMAFGESDELWVGCGKGVDRITLDEEQNIKLIKSFGKEEGFLGVETCQNAVLKDQSGNLWFGTIDGVTKYLPGVKKLNLIPPNLQIKSVELFFEPFEQSAYQDWITSDHIFKKGLQLPHRQNHLSFEFLGINLPNPRKVEYQWFMEGLDPGWSKRSNKNSITYSSIPPGDYVFKVRSFNEDNVSNDPPLEMAFSVLSPLWQRWWFITAAVLLLALVVALVFGARVRQIRKKAKIEKARLEMENNLLQLEQKALQLQMNPHFIFNALNTVQSLFMSNDLVDARQLISRFAKLMRAILENSRTTKIPLQKEIDLLENYLTIEQFSRTSKFDFELKVDPKLDTDEVNVPPMMIQPFVENAIIHGVGHLKSGGLIRIDFEKEDQHLLCRVTDNGIGRKAAAKLKVQNARKHKSVALDVTKERLDFLNQDSNVESLIIKDLVDVDGSATGTEVLIKLPLEEW